MILLSKNYSDRYLQLFLIYILFFILMVMYLFGFKIMISLLIVFSMVSILFMFEFHKIFLEFIVVGFRYLYVVIELIVLINVFIKYIHYVYVDILMVNDEFFYFLVFFFLILIPLLSYLILLSLLNSIVISIYIL